MILQGVGHQISCLGVCYANDPPQKRGYTTPAPALDLTTSLRGDFYTSIAGKNKPNWLLELGACFLNPPPPSSSGSKAPPPLPPPPSEQISGARSLPPGIGYENRLVSPPGWCTLVHWVMGQWAWCSCSASCCMLVVPLVVVLPLWLAPFGRTIRGVTRHLYMGGAGG